MFNLNNHDFESDSIIDEKNLNDQFDLNTYVRLNSNLIAEINNLDKKIQILSPDPKKVTEYIKTNLDNQMLIFLSGEGGVGKTYSIDIINNLMTKNGLSVRKQQQEMPLH